MFSNANANANTNSSLGGSNPGNTGYHSLHPGILDRGKIQIADGSRTTAIPGTTTAFWLRENIKFKQFILDKISQHRSPTIRLLDVRNYARSEPNNINKQLDANAPNNINKQLDDTVNNSNNSVSGMLEFDESFYKNILRRKNQNANSEGFTGMQGTDTKGFTDTKGSFTGADKDNFVNEANLPPGVFICKLEKFGPPWAGERFGFVLPYLFFSYNIIKARFVNVYPCRFDI